MKGNVCAEIPLIIRVWLICKSNFLCVRYRAVKRKRQRSKKFQQSEVPQIEFLTRVAKLPVVSSAIEYATDTYGKAKVRVKSLQFCRVLRCIISLCVGIEPQSDSTNPVDG